MGKTCVCTLPYTTYDNVNTIMPNQALMFDRSTFCRGSPNLFLAYSSSMYYRMKIWQRPIGGHVQTTFDISISGNSPADQNTPYKQLWETSTFWIW